MVKSGETRHHPPPPSAVYAQGLDRLMARLDRLEARLADTNRRARTLAHPPQHEFEELEPYPQRARWENPSRHDRRGPMRVDPPHGMKIYPYDRPSSWSSWEPSFARSNSYTYDDYRYNNDDYAYGDFYAYGNNTFTISEQQLPDPPPQYMRPRWCSSVRWYVLGETTQPLGPHSIDTLHELHSRGYLPDDTLVWAQGCRVWQPILSVLGFSLIPENHAAERNLEFLADVSVDEAIASDDGGLIMATEEEESTPMFDPKLEVADTDAGHEQQLLELQTDATVGGGELQSAREEIEALNADEKELSNEEHVEAFGGAARSDDVVEVGEGITNDLITGHYTRNNSTYASYVFDQMHKQNSFYWNTILSVYPKQGYVASMNKIFTSIPRKDGGGDLDDFVQFMNAKCGTSRDAKGHLLGISWCVFDPGGDISFQNAFCYTSPRCAWFIAMWYPP